MKKLFLLSLLLMLVTFCLGPRAEAALFNRGPDTLGNRLIYDDDRDLTWYDFTNTENMWNDQVAWADALVVDFGGTSIEDWRLPTALNKDGSGPTNGFNADSEMGHLYYDNDALNIDGGGSVNNADNFQNLLTSWYWSGTQVGVGVPFAWLFHFNDGDQDALPSSSDLYGLAVRFGDVAAVPEPTLGLLLGISLVGLVGVGAIRKLKQKAAT